MRKTIGYLLFATAIIGLGVAAYVWNKPHRSIDNVPSEHVTAEAIAQLFETDETLANRNYLNKALTVHGVVGEVAVNDARQQVIFIKGHEELSGVQCTLTAHSSAIAVGDTVEISGFCNGYTVVVILDDCKLLR